MAKTSKPRTSTKPVESELPAIPPPLRMFGALMLLIAMASAFILALDHFAIINPPGCGPQSGCDLATNGPWGTIPVVDWPTSLFGVAYFGGMLVAWLVSTRGIHFSLRAIAWLGLIASAVFVVVMLKHALCKYCLATHIANFAFVIAMEIAASTTRSSERKLSAAPLRLALITFIVLTIGLGITHAQTASQRLARSEAQRQEATDEIVKRSQANQPGDTTPAPTTPNDAIAATQQATETPPPPPPVVAGPPFTGRWRLGPENAPIRIVMFTDYQCPDCHIMESQAMALLQRRSDVSLSVKHFPMCADCNPHVGGSRMHPNACWAARAAETAGMLQGNDGFWKMHAWLFQNKGSFTDQSFPPALQQMGFNVQQFLSVMQSNDTFRPVLADIDEGYELGLHFTPFIFINGVELRGFINNPGALTRTVETLAAQNLPPGDASQDHPVTGVEKFVEDWRRQPKTGLASDPTPHVRGSTSATLQVIVYGDLQDRWTADLHRAIMTELNAGRELSYEFRQYPADQACNPNVQRTVYPMACIAARAAEAAAHIGGEESYWKMHDWLIANQGALNDDAIQKAATETGLDIAALRTAMNSPEVTAAISHNTASGRVYVVNGSIPSIYVNGARVPRWKLGESTVLKQLFDAATQ